ncbi:MAG: hypothetical protein KIT84_43595 [Labilithrix sp.]|nr:hypothetical protein [Labilithrix sp.]MCW5817964.1 hypothetical protein [Labilithrix sp.]
MILSASIAAAAVGCALTYAPGDYGGAAPPAAPDASAPADATPSVDADGDVVTPPIEAGPARPALHLLVVAGERDGADTATSDVWSAPIDERGELGELTVLPPGPVRGPRSAIAIADGHLLVATKTNADRVVERAPFDGGSSFSWQTSVVANPSPTAFGQLFAGSAFVAAGGYTTSTEYDPEGFPYTVTTQSTGVHLSRPDAGVYPKALEASSTKLPTGLHDITFVTYGGLVFFWGDGDAATQRSRIFAARVDPATGLGAIVPLPDPITNPQAGKAHTPATPIACAGEGHLFILGGDKSDVTVTATIDELNATLGPWKAGPPLPTTLKGAGCAVWNGRVHVLGGLAGASNVRSDRIYSATVAADGTMGAWVASPRTLPGPRSNVFALTY